MLGYMISFDTWVKFIRLSEGSERMKDRVITYVVLEFNKPKLLDSLLLGLSFGKFMEDMTLEELTDFEKTILLTRNLNNVPYVKVGQESIS